MWQPEPGWTPLRPGGGASTVGLWRTEHDGRPAVVKRLRRPDADDPAVLSQPTHAGYWRREVEVACDPGVVDGPGLGPPAYLRVDEDEEGATVWAEESSRSRRLHSRWHAHSGGSPPPTTTRSRGRPGTR